MATSPQDYAVWEAGRWSGKARRKNDLDFARDMSRVELDAEQQRQIQRAGLEHAKRLEELKLSDQLNRGAQSEADARRQQNELARIEATTDATNERAKYGDQIAKDREYDERDRAGRGIALDFVGKIDPITGEPHTQASALAQGALSVRQAETAAPRNQLNLAEKYKAIFPRVGEAAMEAQDTEIGASRTERYKQGLQRAASLFDMDKISGAAPVAGELGRSAADREIAVNREVLKSPVLGLGAAGSAVTRGEEDRKTEEAKMANRRAWAAAAENAPGWAGIAAKYLGFNKQPAAATEAPAPAAQPKRRVFDFAPKTVTNNVTIDPEQLRRLGPAVQR